MAPAAALRSGPRALAESAPSIALWGGGSFIRYCRQGRRKGSLHAHTHVYPRHSRALDHTSWDWAPPRTLISLVRVLEWCHFSQRKVNG